MAKTLIFSDLHAHAWGEFSEPIETRFGVMNSRLYDAVHVIDTLRAYARKHDIRRVIFGGDLFHRRRLIDVPVFNAVAAAIHRLSRVVDKLYVLAGNHDLTRKDGSECALLALDKFPRVKVVDKPVAIDDFGLIPYIAEREDFIRALDGLGNVPALVIHQGVDGAVTGPIEYQPLEPITLADLPDVPVFSGHYHTPQSLGPRFSYIGAPLALVRGDPACNRGAVVVDSAYQMRRIRYHGPRFMVVDGREALSDDVKGAFVDLLVDTSIDVPRVTAELKDRGARAINVQYQAEETKAHARTKVKVRKGKLPTVEALCDAYVEQSDTELDTAKLKQLGKLALEKAEVTG